MNLLEFFTWWKKKIISHESIFTIYLTQTTSQGFEIFISIQNTRFHYGIYPVPLCSPQASASFPLPCHLSSPFSTSSMPCPLLWPAHYPVSWPTHPRAFHGRRADWVIICYMPLKRYSMMQHGPFAFLLRNPSPEQSTQLKFLVCSVFVFPS